MVGSHCEINRGSSLLFLKFVNEKYLESLLDGNIFANNFEYFRKLEAEYGEKGIGDEDEACLVIYEIENLTIQNTENKEVLIKIPSVPKVKLSHKPDDKIPIFCLYDMRLEDFKVIEDSEDKLCLLLEFNNEEKEAIRSEFKDKTHVVIIEPSMFIDKLDRACSERGLNISIGRARYYREGVNDEERLEDFRQNRVNKFFWKKDCFTNQKEFRIVFTNKSIDKGEEIVKINNFSQNHSYMTMDELLEGNYELVYNIHKKKDI